LVFVGRVIEAYREKDGYLMSKNKVNEMVTRCVYFENNQIDIQTALDRCFQFLEERRFKEAHVIIEQVLNIDPNNTDAHIANFLYQFKCDRIDRLDHRRYYDYRESEFCNRIFVSKQTPLRDRFISLISELQMVETEIKMANEKRKNEEEKLQVQERFYFEIFWVVFFTMTVVIRYIRSLEISSIIVMPLAVVVVALMFDARKLKKRREKQLEEDEELDRKEEESLQIWVGVFSFFALGGTYYLVFDCEVPRDLCLTVLVSSLFMVLYFAVKLYFKKKKRCKK